jgi:hypothetical protein
MDITAASGIFLGQQSSSWNNNVLQQDFPIPLWEYNKERHGWLQKQYDNGYEKSDWG